MIKVKSLWQTFEEGGGGKRAEAERMFAEATAAAKAAKRAAEGGNDAGAVNTAKSTSFK